MSRVPPALARYRPLVDDWEAFAESIHRPLPVCVWTNPLRTTPEELVAWLRRGGLEPQPVGWLAGAFRLPPEVSPGRRFEHATGLYHVQEEVSLIPPELLDLSPGQRVLDLAAAPGGKAARLAALMGNRGTLVANDRDIDRLSMLRANLDRLGAANVTTTRADAVNYPPEAGLFDRVLADVPCSCEGTHRKSPEVLERRFDEAGLARLGRIQERILDKAVQLCRPGGRIVYSTCTYAPEENELVVDRVLRRRRGLVRLLPAAVTGLRSSPGLTSWAGRRLAPGLAGALRVWPHQNDTGGFFVAVLERTGQGRAPTDPVPLEVEERERWLVPLRERFGFGEEDFAPFALVRSGKAGLSVVAMDHQPPALPPAETVGLPFLHAEMHHPKLTTSAAFAFGSKARRNIVAASQAQIEAYLERCRFRLEEEQLDGLDGGYVLVRFRGVTAGLGMARIRCGAGEIESLFPKRLAFGDGSVAFRP